MTRTDTTSIAALLLMAILSVGLLAGCGGDGGPTGYNDNNDTNGDTTPPPDEDLPTEDLSFSNHIQPIFNGSCGGAGCHIGERQSGVQLDSYDNVINSRGTQYGELIVNPGQPDESPLVDKISSNSPQLGERMPLTGSPLSDDQIQAIRTWIDEGAENN